eukprot:CAMPEP_0170177474 /NCGR_PEP_ID=MMETSP0040_2-20121228/10108_1 /TAXON_ID=641309 /ORGANISM="Lotharella oceanica, Strain CCMP622" /LENGTH=117 /DNA_ID=CAMNT_0010420117 /DNA_START=656 /DNA_END=1010 /DNA_ORIENTATION=-
MAPAPLPAGPATVHARTPELLVLETPLGGAWKERPAVASTQPSKKAYKGDGAVVAAALAAAAGAGGAGVEGAAAGGSAGSPLSSPAYEAAVGLVGENGRAAFASSAARLHVQANAHG